MAMLNFYQLLLQSLVSHYPLEIMLSWCSIIIDAQLFIMVFICIIAENFDSLDSLMNKSILMVVE